jgi:4'-phosphopantetheinyl transferase
MRELFTLPGLGNSVFWPAPPELLLLENEEVHVWLASLEMALHQVSMLEQLLSADELEKAERFHFQADRDHFIVARGMLRSTLGNYLKMDPDKLTFHYGPNGKPTLAKMTNPEMIQFNISHSQGLALCAVAKREVGVDLEYIHADYSFESIAKQFFSQQEVAALNSCPRHLRVNLFFHLWTRKEAYLKAQGLGLSGDMKQYEGLAAAGYAGQISEVNDTSRAKSPWVLMDLAVPPGYAAALVAKGHDLRFKYWQWDNAKPLPTGGNYPAW